MSLDTQTRYPAERSYVLKLHRDAHRSALLGRLENMATGAATDFTSGEQLVAWLANELSGGKTEPGLNGGERHDC